MNRLKRMLKRILIKSGLLRRPELECIAKKETPDFEIADRKKPEYIMDSGQYYEELDDSSNPKIAIQIHVFFLEVMDEIIEILNAVPYPFDCYVSTDTQEKKSKIEKLLQENCAVHYMQVELLENRGRDVGPFLQQMAPVIDKYRYIAHLHTKKSKHTDFGDDWRHFLYRSMFGGRECISAILEMFESDDKLGLIVPEVYPIVRELMAWDNTKEDVQKMLASMGLSIVLPDKPMCPVGDIFWAKTEAVKILFEQGITQNDFQEESGQLNYTLAHVIERIWCYLVQAQGYDYKVCINGIESSRMDSKQRRRALLYKCDEGMTSFEYMHLRELASAFDYVAVLVNSAEERQRLSKIMTSDIIVSEIEDNCVGWKVLLEEKKNYLAEVDEVALADGSGIGPLFDMEQIINKMTEKGISAWSVFKTNLSNAVFSCFNMEQLELRDIIEMVEMDEELEHVYVRESGYIGEWLFTDDPIGELAFDYIILHSPFIKKESLKYLRDNEKVLLEYFLKSINFEKYDRG